MAGEIIVVVRPFCQDQSWERSFNVETFFGKGELEKEMKNILFLENY
jgi:hypothetical protein